MRKMTVHELEHIYRETQSKLRHSESTVMITNFDTSLMPHEVTFTEDRDTFFPQGNSSHANVSKYVFGGKLVGLNDFVKQPQIFTELISDYGNQVSGAQKTAEVCVAEHLELTSSTVLTSKLIREAVKPKSREGKFVFEHFDEILSKIS